MFTFLRVLLGDFLESLRIPLLLDCADLASDEMVYKLLCALDSKRQVSRREACEKVEVRQASAATHEWQVVGGQGRARAI